jgi:hypothetical protein
MVRSNFWHRFASKPIADHDRYRRRGDCFEAREFAMIVTLGRPGTRSCDSRYTPEVGNAIETAYPYTERVAGRTIHLPPG